MGRFFVSDIMVERHWDEMLKVMAHIVPLKVEFRPDLQAYEYLCHSELFDEHPPYCVAPTYECIFTKVPHPDGDDYTFEFKRLNSGRF